MCSGQCAEIWRYVTRHVDQQRNVKKIRGNLLWYQHLEEAEGKPSRLEPEQERRRQLAQGVARLRGELQQLDLQMETAQREVMADEVSLEAAQERIRDAQCRSLLLKAYVARTAKERQQLQASVTQLGGAAGAAVGHQQHPPGPGETLMSERIYENTQDYAPPPRCARTLRMALGNPTSTASR